MGLGLFALEAVGVSQKALIEGGLPSCLDGLCRAVVDAVRGHVADARVLVLVVVPGEESLTEGACIGQATKARRKVGAVLGARQGSCRLVYAAIGCITLSV